MANIERFKRPEVTRIINHCASTTLDDGTVVRTSKSTSSNIDPERTKLNYDLAKDAHPGYSASEYVEHRLTGEGVRVLNRKDVNALGSFIITIPKDLWDEEPERSKEFFQNSYDFFKGIVGEKNIVSAWVHMDETTPHMHFLFTPIVKEKGRPGEHLSAKELLGECYGEEFHLRMKKYLEERMGRDIDVANGKTAAGNRTIAQLKLDSLKSEISDLENDKENLVDKKNELEIRLKKMMKIINSKGNENEELEKEQENLKKQKESLACDVDALRKKYEAFLFASRHADNELDRVQIYNGCAVISMQQWGRWKPYIKNGMAIEKAAENLKKEEENYSAAARTANYAGRALELQKENEELKKKNEEIKNDNEKYEKELSNVKGTLDSVMEFMRSSRSEDGRTNLLMQYEKALSEKIKEKEKEKEKEEEER